jgi:hypothetical protein
MVLSQTSAVKKEGVQAGPAPRDRSCGAGNAFLPAPRELEEQKVLVQTFLFDAFEHFAELAVCQKKAQPFALIAVAIVVQDLFDVHGTLPFVKLILPERTLTENPWVGRLAGHGLTAASSVPLWSVPQLHSVEEAQQ